MSVASEILTVSARQRLSGAAQLLAILGARGQTRQQFAEEIGPRVGLEGYAAVVGLSRLLNGRSPQMALRAAIEAELGIAAEAWSREPQDVGVGT